MAQLNRLCWQARRITLAKSDEIRSTEKLLQLIRDQDQDIAPPAANTTTPRVETEGKTSLFSAITFQKKITIGVDIGHTYIKMAKIHQLPDKSYELLHGFVIECSALLERAQAIKPAKIHVGEIPWRR